VAIRCRRCGVVLWDPASGRPNMELTRHTGRVRAVAFALDGQLLASASTDGTVRLWNPATGRPVWELHPERASRRSRRRVLGIPSRTPNARSIWIWAVTFAPDGRLLAAAGDDGTIRLWDTATGRPVWELIEHTGRVPAVAFAPDGRLLASAGADGTVRFGTRLPEQQWRCLGRTLPWDPYAGRPTGSPSAAKMVFSCFAS
jgi:WD40 repeat protein